MELYKAKHNQQIISQIFNGIKTSHQIICETSSKDLLDRKPPRANNFQLVQQHNYKQISITIKNCTKAYRHYKIKQWEFKTMSNRALENKNPFRSNNVPCCQRTPKERKERETAS